MKGNAKEEFKKLWSYVMELRNSNKGNTIILECDEDKCFKRIYVAFECCKKGFLAGCRRVIGLDGAFLKGIMKGEVLAAVGRDANNQMFPIAWGIVNVENKANWSWFIERLQYDLGFGKGKG